MEDEMAHEVGQIIFVLAGLSVLFGFLFIGTHISLFGVVQWMIVWVQILIGIPIFVQSRRRIKQLEKEQKTKKRTI